MALEQSIILGMNLPVAYNVLLFDVSVSKCNLTHKCTKDIDWKKHVLLKLIFCFAEQ